MKKPTLTPLALLAVTLTGCEEDTRGQIPATQQVKAEVDYQITLLFEVDGIKVYKFHDSGRYVYFTNANGHTGYSYLQYNPATKTSTSVKVQSINNRVDPDCPCREKGGENE